MALRLTGSLLFVLLSMGCATPESGCDTIVSQSEFDACRRVGFTSWQSQQHQQHQRDLARDKQREEQRERDLKQREEQARLENEQRERDSVKRQCAGIADPSEFNACVRGITLLREKARLENELRAQEAARQNELRAREAARQDELRRQEAVRQGELRRQQAVQQSIRNLQKSLEEEVDKNNQPPQTTVTCRPFGFNAVRCTED